jgi:hypothetical protein
MCRAVVVWFTMHHSARVGGFFFFYGTPIFRSDAVNLFPSCIATLHSLCHLKSSPVRKYAHSSSSCWQFAVGVIIVVCALQRMFCGFLGLSGHFGS